MMKKVAIVIMLLLLFIQCKKNAEPILAPLDFSRMNISYSRTGGWINKSILLIDSTGFVEAFYIGHSSDSLLNSTSSNLSETQKKEFELLFSTFSKYDSYYEPVHWYTDGNTHRIVLRYKSKNDTVTVYEPENAEIPNDLNTIINKLYSIWELLL